MNPRMNVFAFASLESLSYFYSLFYDSFDDFNVMLLLLDFGVASSLLLSDSVELSLFLTNLFPIKRVEAKWGECSNLTGVPGCEARVDEVDFNYDC